MDDTTIAESVDKKEEKKNVEKNETHSSWIDCLANSMARYGQESDFQRIPHHNKLKRRWNGLRITPVMSEEGRNPGILND